MLKLAYSYKEEIEKEYPEAIIKSENFFYNMENYHNYKIEIDESSWDRIQYVSVSVRDVEIINGYFCAEIDRSGNFVSNLSGIRFNNCFHTYSKDFFDFFEKLFFEFHFIKIVWNVIIGNPAEKLYDKLIERYNGRIVGTLKEQCRLSDGKLYDQKMYEMFERDYIENWKKPWRIK